MGGIGSSPLDIQSEVYMRVSYVKTYIFARRYVIKLIYSLHGQIGTIKAAHSKAE